MKFHNFAVYLAYSRENSAIKILRILFYLLFYYLLLSMWADFIFMLVDSEGNWFDICASL